MPIQPPDDLAAIDRRMRGRIAPWIRRASEVVGAKIDDARAHAQKAVTDSAKAARDGRATAILVRRSRSYLAAVARLEELLTLLAGPRSTSNAGLIRDAWEASYRDSTAIWRDRLDSSLWRSSDPQPTREGVATARSQFLQGYELHDWIDHPVRRAIADLGRAINLAAATAADESARLDPLDAWESTKRHALTQSVIGAIGDGDQRSHTLAAVDVMALDVVAPEVAAILGT
ncbi:hypothetical protein [Paludisphaera soli]|uniref:hypothetical protein n=1 Tax=Paludisphaera soli TaxID=2712865 RepID=UPI0013E9EE3B|nr:hypothetical protein [Paludisphaera soli]